jgi:hypothetical protein
MELLNSAMSKGFTKSTYRFLLFIVAIGLAVIVNGCCQGQSGKVDTQSKRSVDPDPTGTLSLCTIFDGKRIANRDGEGCWSFRMRD